MEEKLTYEKVLKMFAETDRKLKEQFTETDKRLDKRIAETDKRLDKRIAETDRQLKETDKKLKAMFAETAKQIDGIGKSNGAMAEELFYNALSKKKKIGNLSFTQVERNRQVYDPKTLATLDEIDILLLDKTKIALIEIKYKVSEQDVWDLMTKKPKHFFIGFPEQSGKELYLGIGGCSFTADAIVLAEANNLAVFKIKSETVTDETKKIQAFSSDKIISVKEVRQQKK